MKKIIFIAASAILLSTGLPEKTFAADDQLISVQLKQYIGNKSAVSFRFSGNYLIANSPLLLSPEKTYLLKAEEGMIFLYSDSENMGSLGSTVSFEPATYGTNHTFSLEGRPYLGSMSFKVENGSIRPTNMLPLQDYLKSVVPSEMVYTWHQEALKAQAISARTFIMQRLGLPIDDTTNYQAYKGYNWYEQTSLAVEDTDGLVLKDANGSLVSTFYSSSNGGYTENNQGAWGSFPLPYLPNQEDSFDTALQWTFSLPKIQIPAASLSSDNPFQWDSVQETNAGLATLLKTKLQTSLAASRDSLKIMSIDDVSFSQMTNGQRFSKTNISFTYLHNTGTGVTKSTHAAEVDTSAFRSALGNTAFKSLYVQQPELIGEYFVIKGKGYGHGVGMSQYGAKARAESGQSYQDILAFYYPGTSVEDILDPVLSVIQLPSEELMFEYQINETAHISASIESPPSTPFLIEDTIKSKGTYSLKVPATAALSSGSYTLVLTATDSFGNAATQTIPFTYQKPDPLQAELTPHLSGAEEYRVSYATNQPATTTLELYYYGTLVTSFSNPLAQTHMSYDQVISLKNHPYGTYLLKLTAKTPQGQELVKTASLSRTSEVNQNEHAYIVQEGDTLTKISKQFNSAISLIKERNFLSEDNLHPGQWLLVPEVSAANPIVMPVYHTVVKGDTLYRISKLYGVTMQSLTAENHLTSTSLKLGQRLLVKNSSAASAPSAPVATPVPAAPAPITPAVKTHVVQKGETLYAISRKYGVNITQIQQLNALSSNTLKTGQILLISNSSPVIEKTHVVQRGDTLYSISRHYNIPVATLRSKNKLTTLTLSIGQNIHL